MFLEKNKIYNTDCFKKFDMLLNNTINLTITDIPYNMVNRKDNGLRNLNKKDADILTFNLQDFLKELYRITSGTIIIFCGINQVSEIYQFFAEKQEKHKGTVRQLIWQKSNPSPMNGQYIYLSGIENAVWFKKRNGVFNAHCKNTVFKHPTGRSKLHPTEKNHALLKELIEDNSKKSDILLDPCCGSGSHCFVAKQLKREFIGFEINSDYVKIANKRLKGLK